MKRLHLGEFEELVLLIVGILGKEAYALSVTRELAKQSDRKVGVSSVHKALYRLEEKGMLESQFGEAEAKRGGKRKRIFIITAYGKKALDSSLDLRYKLRSQMPGMPIEWKIV